MANTPLIYRNQQDIQPQDWTTQTANDISNWFAKNVTNPQRMVSSIAQPKLEPFKIDTPTIPNISPEKMKANLGLDAKGVLVNKPTNSLNDFTKKNSGYIGTAVNAVEPMMQLAGAKQADNITAGEQVFSKGSDLAFNMALKSGDPLAIGITAGLKGLDLVNRYAGSTAKEQLTNDANTGAYQSKIESKAGTKGTLLMGDIFGGTKRTNKRVDNANAFNTIASYAQTANKQNNLSAQNTFYDFQEKNKNKLNGGISTNMLTAKKGAKINPAQLRNLVHKAQKGMKVKPAIEEIEEIDVFKFADGGKLNVIPEGALHARKHNLDVDFKDSITDKGIPVITFEDGEVKQHAEIELNEIIFHKDVTDKLEAMFKKYKEAKSAADKKLIAIECGKFLASEILENTDDRTGLIEKIE